MVQDAEAAEMPQDKLKLHVTNPPLERYFTHWEKHTQTITSFTRQGLYDMRIATCHPMCLMLRDRTLKYWRLAVCSQGCCTTSKASSPVSKHCINLLGSVCFACFARLSFKQLIMCLWAVLLLQPLFQRKCEDRCSQGLVEHGCEGLYMILLRCVSVRCFQVHGNMSVQVHLG